MTSVEADNDDAVDGALAIARSSEPCSGEMNNRPKPRSSVTDATPSANSAKNGLAKTCEWLRGEDADHRRRPGRQHPRDGVRPITEPLSHLADPIGGLRPETVGAVEGE